MRQHLGSLAGGLVGGALGTVAIRASMKLAPQLPMRMRAPSVHKDPGEYIIERLEQRRGGAFSQKVHERAIKGAGWAYGITWASILAALGPWIGMHKLGRAVGAGAALGAGVWALGYLGWLPRLGLVEPPRRSGIGQHATNLVGHVAYGVLAALPIYAANRMTARRR
jgi:hypothetical protein